MYQDAEVNEKMAAEREYLRKSAVGATLGQAQAYRGDTCGGEEASPSIRRQAEQQVGYHRTQADKWDRAAVFFRENPSFDEFIQLVRSGVIQF